MSLKIKDLLINRVSIPFILVYALKHVISPSET